MGFMDKIKQTVGGHTDKASSVIDKAADMVDEKTGNKHSDKIDNAVAKAKDAVDKIDGKTDNNK